MEWRKMEIKKREVNEPSPVKSAIGQLAWRLMREHPDCAPLQEEFSVKGGTRNTAIIGALIEYVEILEGRIRRLENQMPRRVC